MLRVHETPYGSKFDGHGNLKDWWTQDDQKNFKERAGCVQAQFDSYVVDGDLHENGKLVLGESIADLGGLAISYAAYEKSAQLMRDLIRSPRFVEFLTVPAYQKILSEGN